jgi:hypothetical protein
MRDVLRDFPAYAWICKLEKGRYFSGSLGTSPTKGSMDVYMFQYKICVETETEEVEGNEIKHKFIAVNSEIRPPVNSGEEIFAREKVRYPLSKENAEEARKWLLTQIENNPCIGKAQK